MSNESVEYKVEVPQDLRYVMRFEPSTLLRDKFSSKLPLSITIEGENEATFYVGEESFKLELKGIVDQHFCFEEEGDTYRAIGKPNKKLVRREQGIAYKQKISKSIKEEEAKGRNRRTKVPETDGKPQAAKTDTTNRGGRVPLLKLPKSKPPPKQRGTTYFSKKHTNITTLNSAPLPSNNVGNPDSPPNGAENVGAQSPKSEFVDVPETSPPSPQKQPTPPSQISAIAPAPAPTPTPASATTQVSVPAYTSALPPATAAKPKPQLPLKPPSPPHSPKLSTPPPVPLTKTSSEIKLQKTKSKTPRARSKSEELKTKSEKSNSKKESRPKKDTKKDTKKDSKKDSKKDGKKESKKDAKKESRKDSKRDSKKESKRESKKEPKTKVKSKSKKEDTSSRKEDTKKNEIE